MSVYDKRLHAVRPDLADARLEGHVASERFVAGRPARIAVAVADLRREPRSGAGLSNQLQRGDDVMCFEEVDGWAWVQGRRDGYVGYVEAVCLGDATSLLTHLVTAPRTFIYPGPDLKLARTGALSMGASLSVENFVETRGTCYAVLSSGDFVIAEHLRPVDKHAADFVAIAEKLIHTPYLWGGSTGFGIDCSGLVQLSMRMAGRDVLRDSDMQSETVGETFDVGDGFSDLRRGDLVFWKGHVAILTSPEWIIHANGHTMLVSHERLADAIDRIGYLYGAPTGFRRP